MKNNYYNFNYLAGLAVGFILVGLVLFLIRRFSTKKSCSKNKYDERQELIRGRGFKYGYFTTLMLNAISLAFTLSVEGTFLKKYYALISFGILCLSVLVYVVYCILNDSYFPLNQKASSMIVIFALILICNLVVFIIHPFKTQSFMNLMCAIMFLIIIVTISIKKIVDNKNVQ